MKRIILLSSLLLFVSAPVLASGIILHMFMAEKATEHVATFALREFLQKERDSYLNGIIYPDAGYLADEQDGVTFGEYSHWSKFSNAYLTHLLAKCTTEELLHNPKCRTLLAHFMGTIGHTIGDINFDSRFVPMVAEMEYRGNMHEAQGYTDIDLDFLAIVEFKRNIKLKKIVPIADLVEVYHSVNMDVRFETIRKLTNRQYWLNLKGMYFTAPHVYKRIKQNCVRWSTENYYSAKGGVVDSAMRIARAMEHIWHMIIEKPSKPVFYDEGAWPDNRMGISAPEKIEF